jgi:putative redox protein
MASPKPPTVIDLDWDAELRLHATAGGNRLIIDSAGTMGASPMQVLAIALAGCMAMDLIHILTRGRYDLRGLHARLTGQRAAEDPHRFTAISLHFSLTGPVPHAQVQRAIDLSREKYCSVWNSMRQDIAFEVTYDVGPRRDADGRG